MSVILQLVNGLALGSVYALLAIGFSMIYGMLRMMNFAHGDTYAFSAIFVAAMLLYGVPFFPAACIGVVAGASIAMLIERVCYRPLRTVDRTVSLISSLGAAFILRNASEYFWGSRPSPFQMLFRDANLTISGTTFSATGFIILAIGLITIVLFNLFLRKTRIGRGIALVAQDIPTASLMGVSVNRTVVLVYALGGALGALGGILYGTIYGIVFPSMGFVGTIKAFIAAVVGGIGNLTGALIAGLFLGLIETLVVVYGTTFFGFTSGYRDVVAFVILIVFLLFRPTGLMGTRLAASETGTTASMGYSSKERNPRVSLFGVVSVAKWQLLAGIAIAVVVFIQLIDDPYLFRILTLIMIYGTAVLGLNLVYGYCGQLHFGQAGFVAIGAYVTALMMVNWDTNFLVALICSGTTALLFGVLLGIPALRIRSDYLALVTLAFGEIVRLVLLNSEFSRGPMGIPGIPIPQLGGVILGSSAWHFYYALALVLLTYVFCVRITKSHIGRAWTAIAEDEIAASSMGVNVGRYKLLAFALACMIGGLAGSDMALFMRFIAPNSFSLDLSVLLIVMLVIGGMGNLNGSLVGAAIMIGAVEIFRPLADFRTALIGLMMVIIPIYRPEGLFVGLWRELSERGLRGRRILSHAENGK